MNPVPSRLSPPVGAVREPPSPPPKSDISPLPKIPIPCYPLPMKELHEVHKEMEDFLDKLQIPKEPPKGSLYDLSSDLEEENKRQSGGQPGNQNARKHGLYSKHFTPGQAEQLENADDLKDLAPEINLLRVKLNGLLDDPNTSPDLILKIVNALARLMSVQRRYIYG